MPNLTTALPRRTGDIEEDYKRLFNWAVSLTDELKNLLCNLDAGNVTEAAKVKVQNLDATQARIKDAMISSLTADKLTAGTIDTEEITIQNTDSKGSIEIKGQQILFKEGKSVRIGLGRDDDGKYKFTVQNTNKTQGIYMDGDGNVSITGELRTTGNGVIGGSIKLGEVIDPAIYFLKTSGSEGARIYFDDSQDMLVINANNIKLDGTIVS